MIVIETPDGPFSIIADDACEVVLAAGWTGHPVELMPRIAPQLRPMPGPTTSEAGVLASAASAVRRYYDGDATAILDVPVKAAGTELTNAVWRALRSVPAGAPVDYSALAALAGAPRAVRAAASACARNPIALFVPCHRAVRRDGGLGGFAWGLPVKESLLRREVSR